MSLGRRCWNWLRLTRCLLLDQTVPWKIANASFVYIARKSFQWNHGHFTSWRNTFRENKICGLINNFAPDVNLQSDWIRWREFVWDEAWVWKIVFNALRFSRFRSQAPFSLRCYWWETVHFYVQKMTSVNSNWIVADIFEKGRSFMDNRRVLDATGCAKKTLSQHYRIQLERKPYFCYWIIKTLYKKMG